MHTTEGRLPTYFVSHGGGPWPWIKEYMPAGFDMTALEASLQAIPRQLGRTPRAVLVISGHWEAPVATIQTSPHPPMYYDYGGFPEFTYRIQYPSPGAPDVAARVGELLTSAGIPHATDARRGYDHGTFAPLYVMYPDASVPVLQLSIRHDYDPGQHLAIGRALAPLRDEGVLILGSGFSFHNLAYFMRPGGAHPSHEFDRWLIDAVTATTPAERVERLLAWERAPSARICHPAEDHLVPLFVAVGAAEQDSARVVYHEDNFAGAGIASTSFALGL
jgi:aromatic ring-opening dioxygenase catalytic subunit (LigB family)